MISCFSSGGSYCEESVVLLATIFLPKAAHWRRAYAVFLGALKNVYRDFEVFSPAPEQIH